MKSQLAGSKDNNINHQDPTLNRESRCRSTEQPALPNPDDRKIYKHTLSAITGLLEAKDLYTYGHSYRVSQYALAIARQMDLQKEQLEALEIGGLLHDIGKIGISDSILNKASKLTGAEYDLIKTHPKRGYMILWGLPELKYALDVVLYHHERYDGHGYPDGLRGEEIPLLARILAVADAYDAMTSKRPYRPAMTHSEAIQELRRNIGTQLDPQIAGIFISFRELGEIRQVIEAATDLPSFSPVVQKALQVLDQPEPNITELAEILNSDQGIAAKILRIVNSAYYGLHSEIVDTRSAVSYLGTNEISKLLVSIAAQPLLNTSMGHSLWHHSLTTAFCAEGLAKRTTQIDPGKAFMAGLLHDMGKVLLVHYFPAAYRRMRSLVVSGTSNLISEVIVFGVDHAEIGAWLMEHWELPDELVNSIRFHHVRDLSNKPLTRVVTFANTLANYFEGSEFGLIYDAELLDDFRLALEDLDRLRVEVTKMTNAIQETIHISAI